jgi:hypothetical protein
MFSFLLFYNSALTAEIPQLPEGGTLTAHPYEETEGVVPV